MGRVAPMAEAEAGWFPELAVWEGLYTISNGGRTAAYAILALRVNWLWLRMWRSRSPLILSKANSGSRACVPANETATAHRRWRQVSS
jgi:hypothetical protein